MSLHIVLPLEHIVVPEKRQRTLDSKVEAHIQQLSQEIEKDGLIHAPTIDKTNALTAGFCRLNAIRLLQKPYFYAGSQIAPGFIPVVVTHWEKEKDLFRIELMENLRRQNLTPVDEAKALAELHRHLVDEHDGDWSETDTGKEVDKLRGEQRTPKAVREEVSEALLVERVASNPEVQKAKSRGEAVKIAKKLLTNDLMQSLGALTQTRSNDLRVIHGSCIEVMEKFEPGTFHGIVTDPPYGIDADKFGEQTMKGGGHQYEDTEESAIEIAGEIFRIGHRITKENAHLYMFCDIRFWPQLRSMAELYNWKPFPTPLIWHKPSSGHVPIPGYFGRRYEAILFCQKGDRKLAKARSDVFEYQPVKDKIHAAQKPVDLLKELCSLSFFPGEHILDPCVGSGSTLLAARELKLKATGIELSDDSYRLAMAAIAGG